MRKKLFIFAAVLLCFLSGYVVSVHSEESMTVSCYKGDPGDNYHVGDVEAFQASNAARACNMIYYDCNGNCTGCYISGDGSQICVDPTGRQYTRQ